MKTITSRTFSAAGAVALTASFAACAHSSLQAPPDAPSLAEKPAPQPVHAGELVIERDENTPRPPFDFSDHDAHLLDEIQRGSLAFFLHATDPATGMVYDRTSNDTISIAGVGFQLAALTIGVERGWLPRDDANRRAEKILAALLANPHNRKAGLFYHFLNPTDASPRRIGTELVVSTVDSALLFSGAIVAGEYFGGTVNDMATAMLRDADWSFFQNNKVDFERGDAPAPDKGFITLGWRPADDENPTGPGELIPYSWVDSGDEHRLTTFLAVSAPDPDHRLPPEIYYNLRRQVGFNPDAPEGERNLVWFPYSGALFTAFFAHCFIDYAALGTDQPLAFGAHHRPQTDWWENSRRLANLHRDKAIANPENLPTFGVDAWGLSACDGPDGYLVPGVFPQPVEMLGAAHARDYTNHQAQDRWGGGVVAPYAAGSSIVFEPRLALSALRNYRTLQGPQPDGSTGPLAWRGAPSDPTAPDAKHRYGLVDSYRAPSDSQPAWIAPDSVSIDQGPLIICIENARSGLVWDLFHANDAVREGLARLDLTRDRESPRD